MAAKQCPSCRSYHKGNEKCKPDKLLCNCGRRHHGKSCPKNLKPSLPKRMKDKGWKW